MSCSKERDKGKKPQGLEAEDFASVSLDGGERPEYIGRSEGCYKWATSVTFARWNNASWIDRHVLLFILLCPLDGDDDQRRVVRDGFNTIAFLFCPVLYNASFKAIPTI
jgi:hypothetical protein